MRKKPQLSRGDGSAPLRLAVEVSPSCRLDVRARDIPLRLDVKKRVLRIQEKVHDLSCVVVLALRIGPVHFDEEFGTATAQGLLHPTKNVHLEPFDIDLDQIGLR
jgi:hypothetical protein